MVVNMVIAAFMLILIALIWMVLRKVEYVVDMTIAILDGMEKVNSLVDCLKRMLAVNGEQLEIMEKMAGDIGVIQSQAESIHCQGEAALENSNKILEQMDDITNAASAQDLVTQGMNNLMNFTGMVGGEK